MSLKSFSSFIEIRLLVCLALATSLANADVPQKTDLLNHVNAAQTRWEWSHIQSYAYVVEKNCMLCEPPAKVMVKNNKCVSAVTVAEPAKNLSCAGRTVPEMFESLHRWIEDGATSTLEVTFDDKLGYPVKLFLKTNMPHETEHDEIKQFRKLE